MKLSRSMVLLLLFISQHLYAHSQHPSSIEIVYHIATLNQWEEVVEEQLQTLQSSGLADACDRLTVTVVGPYLQAVHDLFQRFAFYPKTRILHASTNVLLCEFPAIEMVQQISHEKPNANILYMHSKGVSYQKTDRSRNVRSWRRYLEYFVITKWQDCIEALKSANICGAEWLNCRHVCIPQIEIPGFFAGNFWWARAEYLRTCHNIVPPHPWDPQLLSNHRYDCEVFVGTGANPIAKTLHQSGVNLYEFNYTPEYYLAKDESNHDNIEIVYHIIASKDRCHVVQAQLQLLQQAGLAEACNRITAIVLGPEFQKVEQLFQNSPFYSKVRLIHASSELHLDEFPAIELVKRIARANPNAKICYIHNLGEKYCKFYAKTYTSILHAIRHTFLQKRKEITALLKSWKQRLFFGTETGPSTDLVIQQWRECVKALQTSNLCGVTWKKGVPRRAHFPDVICAGYFQNNCWWARGAYINTCQDVHYRSPFNLYRAHWSREWLQQYCLDCQMFIGTGNQVIVQELEAKISY